MKARRARIVLAVGLVMAAAAHAGPAQVVATSPAVLEPTDFRLDFVPQVEHDGAILTLSGPDHFYLRQTFAAADAISIPAELDGASLPDGQYAWEITFSPKLSARTRVALAEARASGDEAALVELRRSGELPSSPMVAAGFFRVRQGAFLAGDATEPGSAGADSRGGVVRQTLPDQAPPGVVRVATADQVIPDDLIVQSSLCVGVDCVNGENFGFDTIRMKENNTRIDFTDTSTAAGFPSQDWEIAANDSASGGRNALIFKDENTELFVVESGNAGNALYVDSTGDVGLGTSTPVLDLHISRSDTPALRLEQNNSGGFTAQTWDVAGNEANFFVRDVTGGSLLSFRVRPGAPTSSIDISADGDVGIGTGSPDNPLHVFESSTTFVAALNLENEGGDVGFRLTNDTGLVDINLIEAAGLQEFRINIGAAPAELVLQQDGDLIVTGTYTPDYVFEPDYPLLSLDELARFIDENGHLPNVPSDAEVKRTGRINLSEFQLRLLEKIEELTLYTLDQHSDLRALEQENLELRQRLERLEHQATHSTGEATVNASISVQQDP